MWVVGYCPGITQLFPTWHTTNYYWPSISTYLCRVTKLLVIITIQHFPHLQFPFSLEPISAYRAPSLNFCEFILIFLGLSSHHWTEIPPKKCWTFLAICLYPDFFTKSWRGISLSKYNNKNLFQWFLPNQILSQTCWFTASLTRFISTLVGNIFHFSFSFKIFLQTLLI